MSKGGSGLGIGTFIVLIFLYNLLFDDDNDDKKEVNIVDKAKKVTAEAARDVSDVMKEIKPKLKEAVTSAKEKFKEDNDTPPDEPFKEDVELEKKIDKFEKVSPEDPKTKEEEFQKL